MAARSLGPATIRISALLLFWFNGVVLADSPPPLQSEMQLGFSGRTRRDFLDTVKRVGVLPVRMSEYLGEHPEAGQIAQESVTKYLRVAGFDVAAPDYFNETYELLNREAGGVYSSQTGAPRREVAAAVFGRAIEAYIARERLDGFVTVSIVERSGEFAGERVSWDNVEDLSTGSESGDLSYQIQGKLPVVSLAIEIYDAVGKRMFSRAGGIQPAVYVQDEIFVNVAPADLLKDAARLDRAARSATLPLIYTGRQIADQRYEPQKTGWIQQHTRPLPPAPPPLPQLPALAPLPPAAPFEQTSQLFVAREEILRAVHGAGLAFIDTDALNVPDEVRVRLVRAVLDELSPLQWQVVEAKRAREVMLEYLKGDGLFDPLTGRIDE